MIYSYAKSIVSNWNSKGFVFLIGISLLILFVVILFHIGKKGKYNKNLPSVKSIIKNGIDKHILNGANLSENVGNMNYIQNNKENIRNNTINRSYDPYRDSTAITPGESKPERECRRVLESIFNVPFNKCRPDVLRNNITKNYNLELDCYNADLRLALEYNGQQHYKYIPYFHKNKEAFHNQQYRDELKRRICKEKGIRLIEVPYTVKLKDIEKYIIKKLKNI